MSNGEGSNKESCYEISNSSWRNVCVFLLCLGLTLAGLLAVFGSSHRAWSMILGVLFFTAGTFLFGGRAMDTGIKVRADGQGIEDFRNPYGLIKWGEIQSIRAWSVKGNYYVTLNLRNPEKWLSMSSRWTRWLGKRTKMKFGITISLQNMAVNEQEFTRFISGRIAAASSDVA